MIKTPLGVTPRVFWLENRIQDLSDAVQRYLDAGLPVPVEWTQEYNDRVKELRELDG